MSRCTNLLRESANLTTSHFQSAIKLLVKFPSLSLKQAAIKAGETVITVMLPMGISILVMDGHRRDQIVRLNKHMKFEDIKFYP